jgi:hypothetical protein
MKEIDVKVLASINLLSAGLWHVVHFSTRQSGENTAVVLQALYYLLPLLTIILSLILLGSGKGNRWCYGKWRWPAVAAGFTPCITFCLYIASSR